MCNFENQYFCSRAYLLFYVFAGKKDLKLWWKQKVQNLWGGEKERDRGHQILKSHLHCLICVRWWNHLINICTLHATMLWNPEKVTFFPRLLVSLITYVRSYNHSWFRLWFFLFSSQFAELNFEPFPTNMQSFHCSLAAHCALPETISSGQSDILFRKQ